MAALGWSVVTDSKLLTLLPLATLGYRTAETHVAAGERCEAGGGDSSRSRACPRLADSIKHAIAESASTGSRPRRPPATAEGFQHGVPTFQVCVVGVGLSYPQW